MMLLPQLPNPHHRFVSGGYEFMIPERHFPVLELLPRLRHLNLSLPSDATWGGSILDPLKNMSDLTFPSLHVYDVEGPLLVWPSLAQLTQLQSLYLECRDTSFPEIRQAHLMQTSVDSQQA